MNSLGNILYSYTLLHIICEHSHDLYTLNSLSGWKGLKKFIPRDSLNSPLIYILFSMIMRLLFKDFSFTGFTIRDFKKSTFLKSWSSLNQNVGLDRFSWFHVYWTKTKNRQSELYILGCLVGCLAPPPSCK